MRLILWLAAMLLAVPTIASAGGDRGALRDLVGVAVEVTVDVPSGLRPYCDSLKIRTQTESKLRQYGVRVLSTEEMQEAECKPSLTVSLLGTSSGRVHAISVRLAVNLFVEPEGKPRSSAFFADAWSIESVLLYSTSTARTGSVYTAISELCDQFVNDWAAAHGN